MENVVQQCVQVHFLNFSLKLMINEITSKIPTRQRGVRLLERGKIVPIS